MKRKAKAKDQDKEHLFTAAKAAAYCGFSPSYLRRLTRSERVANITTPYGSLYSKGALDEFLRLRRREVASN